MLLERLDLLPDFSLGAGGHASLQEGACVMEMVSYIAGEPFSDHPACACPVITAFMTRWNDGLPNNAARDRWIKPLVLEIVGSRALRADGTDDTEVLVRRAFLCADAACRQFAPLAFEAAGRALALAGLIDHAAEMAKHAAQMRALPVINSAESARAARAASAAGAAGADSADSADQINESRVAVVREILAVLAVSMDDSSSSEIVTAEMTGRKEVQA